MVKIVYMGHPAHFCGAEKCDFRLATAIVGKKNVFIVSTIGQYSPVEGRPCKEIGAGRLFETYVFIGRKEPSACGCYEILDYSDLDSSPANNSKDASANHERAVRKWSKIEDLGVLYD